MDHATFDGDQSTSDPPIDQKARVRAEHSRQHREFNTLGEFFRKVGNMFRSKTKQREVEQEHGPRINT